MNEKLRTARLEKNLTQEQLAAIAGYKSKSAINMIEKGVNQPPVTVALKIAEAVGKSVEYLFGDLVVHESSTFVDGQATAFETA